MLGGEIYYRAIGRPWGPAADFIITRAVKFHPLTGTTRSAGPSEGGPGRPRAVGATRAFKFESGRAGRLGEYSGPPSAGPSRHGAPCLLHKNKLASRCCHRAGKRFKMNNRKLKNVACHRLGIHYTHKICAEGLLHTLGAV
jgi:hypothetical protein